MSDKLKLISTSIIQFIKNKNTLNNKNNILINEINNLYSFLFLLSSVFNSNYINKEKNYNNENSSLKKNHKLTNNSNYNIIEDEEEGEETNIQQLEEEQQEEQEEEQEPENILINDFLLIIFIEIRNNSNNLSNISYNNIIEWLRSRLNIIITTKDAALLVRYIQLYRPLMSENILEYEAFENMKKDKPLTITLPKEEWCKKTIEFIEKRTKEMEEDKEVNSPQKNDKSSLGFKKLFRGFSRGQSIKIAPLEEAEDSVMLRKITTPAKPRGMQTSKSSTGSSKKIEETNVINTNLDLSSPSVENTEWTVTQQFQTSLLTPQYNSKQFISKYSSSSASIEQSLSPIPNLKQISLESLPAEEM